MTPAARLMRWALLLPIQLYRWTLKPLMGGECRYLPTCSAYAMDAIERNGAWRGFWLMLARLCRCHPLGGHGYDPAPDLVRENHPWWAPWRYGRWKLPVNSEPAAPHEGGAG